MLGSVVRKQVLSIMSAFAVAAVLALSAPAFAHGAGGGGGFGGGFGGGAALGGPGGGLGGFGGNSGPHISTQGVNNSNGPNSPDRDLGLEHARDRMNSEGLQHNQAPGSPQ